MTTGSGGLAAARSGSRSGACPGTRFRQLYSNFDNIVFDGLDIDAGRAKTSGGAAFESHGDNATFKNGSIGNVTDEKGALISGSNFTFDNVLFHDVRLATAGVHNECVYAIVVPGFTIRNSTFRNCVTMDLAFTYGSWWNPLPPQYGNVTIEEQLLRPLRLPERGHDPRIRPQHRPRRPQRRRRHERLDDPQQLVRKRRRQKPHHRLRQHLLRQHRQGPERLERVVLDHSSIARSAADADRRLL